MMCRPFSSFATRWSLVALNGSRRARSLWPSRVYSSSAESDQSTVTKWPFYMVLTGIFGGAFYVLGKPDDARPYDPARNAFLQYFSRAKANLADFIHGYEEPAFKKLLPDIPANDPHRKPYTLVIDLDRFLVCHVWDPAQGKWKIAKRPGAEVFLFYMAQLYEIVVFSSLSQFEGDAIVKKLDPFGCISFSLFRFATHYKDGVYVKDIGNLNRDLKKIIILGHDEKGFSTHPENFIQVNPWEGNPTDRQMEEMIDFFEAFALSNVLDIRPVVQNYKDKDLVATYDKIQKSIFEEMVKNHTEGIHVKVRNWLYARLGWEVTPSSDSNIPSYEEKKKQIRQLRLEEYEKAKAIMNEQLRIEMEKEKQMLAQNKMPFFDLVTKGPPQPPPAELRTD